MQWRREDGYWITTERGRFDLDVIWGFLRTSYWSADVPREVVERAMEGAVSP